MTKKYFYIATLIFSGLLLGSCKKYLDINQNPNAAQEPPIKGLLANSTYNTGENIFNAANITSYYVQYLAGPSAAGSTDTYDDINASGTWDGFYNTMTDIYDMRKLGNEKGLAAYVGVADILMAINLSTVNNIWGNVPYDQAFMGVTNLNPTYQDQKVIYDSCMTLLNNGIAALQQPNLADQLDAASDFVHGGNIDAWIKTAHMLKARLLTLVSKTANYNADEVLSELALSYAGNADDAQITAYVQDVNSNPWGSVAIANAGLNLDGWLSTHFVNATNAETFGVFDPRLPLITQKTMFGDYRGTINGAGRVGTGTEHEECYLDVDKWYSTQTSPLQIATYAEAKFIEAEAQFRKGNKPEAYTAYLDGMKAQMAKMGVADTAVTRYTTAPAVAVGSANLTLDLIMKEKYVATFLSPVTWDDMRRMDYAYTDFDLPVGAVLPTFIRRVNYPTNEISRNGKNVPSVEKTDHLWWDQ